jgi:hypothetical protein
MGKAVYTKSKEKPQILEKIGLVSNLRRAKRSRSRKEETFGTLKTLVELSVAMLPPKALAAYAEIAPRSLSPANREGCVDSS